MRPRFASAGHTLLGEPLDGAGNRGSGFWLQQAQVRGHSCPNYLTKKGVSSRMMTAIRARNSISINEEATPMTRFCSIFTQLLQLFPRSEFQRAAIDTRAETPRARL